MTGVNISQKLIFFCITHRKLMCSVLQSSQLSEKTSLFPYFQNKLPGPYGAYGAQK